MSAPRPSVLVVHGLWMNGLETHFLRQRLGALGLAPRAFSYHSMHAGLDEVLAALAAQVRALPPPVHVVGHSLGGVLLLELFARVAALPPGRVVLLGAPANGSEAACAVSRWPVGPAILGRLALEQLVTTPRHGWSGTRELGVIAGSLSAGMGRVVARLPEPNDGTVAVAETRVDGMREHLVLPVTHTGMLFSGEVAGRTARFLEGGRF